MGHNKSAIQYILKENNEQYFERFSHHLLKRFMLIFSQTCNLQVLYITLMNVQSTRY